MRIEKNKLRKPFAVLILAVCIVLLQAHSIPFWLTQTNSDIGYLWSFTIEGASLWLWLNKKLILATVASFIVLLVPIVELNQPLLSEMRQVSVNIQLSEYNNADFMNSKSLQKKLLKTNWAGHLNKNNKHFNEVINTQKELLKDSIKLRSHYENILIIILQSIALIVVLLTQIQAIKILSFQEIEKVETTNFSYFGRTEITENRAEILLEDIETYMLDNDITQSELADKLNVKSSDFSKLKNKAKRLSGEFLSDKKVSELESKFKTYINKQSSS